MSFGGKIKIFNIGYFDDSETIIPLISEQNFYTPLINENLIASQHVRRAVQKCHALNKLQQYCKF